MNKLPSLTRTNKILKINESKLDRYFLYYKDELLREPEEDKPNAPCLTATELDMLKKYERVYEMFDIGRTDGMIRSFLMKDYDVKERQARYIIEEARIIYGITGKADKEGRKQASINYYRTLSNIAFKKGDYVAAAALNHRADVLEGLYNENDIGLDPADFGKVSNFTFVNNLQVVMKSKKQEFDE